MLGPLRVQGRGSVGLGELCESQDPLGCLLVVGDGCRQSDAILGEELCDCWAAGIHGRTALDRYGWHSGSCPPVPTRGLYRIEENVVKAGGHGCHLAPGGAALLLQPAPPSKSKQHQEDEEEQGTANRGWH